MPNLVNVMLSVFQEARDERGAVSVEWILLTILIMVAIIAAFNPQFQAAITAGVTAVGTAVTAQAGAAGS
jgi:Flp pilus assembly pilin Flp